MIKTARFAVLTVAVVALAGCANRPMNQLGSVSPSGTAFDNSLAQQYMGLSGVEKASGDHKDADAYARRAMAAAEGNPTQPDAPEYRQLLPNKYKAELTAERQRLVTALDSSGRTKAPADAARAQAMYDCWIEQATENFQEKHIQACRDAYMTAIAKVEAALAVPAPVAAPSNYLVFFDFGKSTLTPEAVDIVNAAASGAMAPGTSITVIGNTDTVGSAEYNMALGQRRADAVAAQLNAAGFQGAITTESRGENNLLVPTGDGVAEPQNRRAEILIVVNKPAM
jgi:OOP family OmpA-OmpF porin